jgi:PKD repeat protein
VMARDANGRPQRDLALRAEVVVFGVIVDFGQLSARTIVTGQDGRATLSYTAPPAPRESVDSGMIATIRVTPSGGNYANAVGRDVDIRLVPPGIIMPPTRMVAEFSFSPTSPREAENVLFDGSATQDPDRVVISYTWSFGDGRTGSGRTVTHSFARAGNYPVTLTVSDGFGRASSATKPVQIGAGMNPTAAFAFSPTTPGVNETVFFNASGSIAAAGRQIVSYTWTFGDGGTGSGLLTSRRYGAAGSYNVVLTVTDDAGRSDTAVQTVTVGAGQRPAAEFVFSPTNPGVNQWVNFDATPSMPPPGRAITAYEWNFGDGHTSAGPRSAHRYSTAGDYVVVLTVTDSAGAKATASRPVQVQ